MAVGYMVSVVAGDTIVGATELPREVKARTFPGLLDLGIGVTAGVGIAVALVPPLAAVGITLEVGATSESVNAMLLYGTNLAGTGTLRRCQATWFGCSRCRR